MINVLLVGSGAREHAIAESVARSEKARLFSVMSGRNPGIMAHSKKYIIGNINDRNLVTEFANQNRIDIAIVGPEAPLVNGVADALEEKGIGCVGPRKSLAMIEGDKAFCRELMKKYSITGLPHFKVLSDMHEASDFVDSVGMAVIKPAGLTGGKGVQIIGEHLKDRDAATQYIQKIFDQKPGGIGKVVVEERLDGEEYTLQAFVDGKNLKPMPCVQDHKRAYDGDVGPNTGGMGSYSDKNHLLPFLKQEEFEESIEIMKKTVDAMKRETGLAYKGILYGQFLLGRGSVSREFRPWVIEFNCRFGDPENMNVLPLLSEDTDPVEIYCGIASGNITKSVKFKSMATVCKYLVPSAYPGNVKPGDPITVDENIIEKNGAQVFYASVDMVNDKLVTTTSRTVAVTSFADTITEAERITEKATGYVKGNLRHRRDIGTEELIQKRIEHVRKLR
jgi:phosphoribosylamine--glycine ligase